ncbi:MAG: aldehyde-activating protein [Maricaulis sp.]|jgi:hypothetical protein|nr:aldehyde-activating protein [Maricaulis sp.]HAQ33800.1 aldehyde-activating protein [Alphaproteobacteria bacterium]|tara:strand:+ start:944 stop:1372 length:429 start_codon:yes stop_codon:yes gene_type:complete
MSHPVKGQCLCGATKFAVTLKNSDVDACHCAMCRSWSAGPFMGVVATSGPEFEDEASVGIYRSSEWAERVFCKNCGSAIAWRMADGQGHVAISAGTVPLPDDAKLTLQVFIDQKPEFYSFAEKTKEMTGPELIAAFSGGEGA